MTTARPSLKNFYVFIQAIIYAFRLMSQMGQVLKNIENIVNLSRVLVYLKPDIYSKYLSELGH